MKLISNEELYKLARAASTTFEKVTPADYATFSHDFAGLSASDARQLLNDFTNTILAVYLNKVEGVKAKNPWDTEGLIERFYVPFAGLKQNMYVTVKAPINPKFKTLTDGSSVDQQMITKGSVEDIFYTFNDDYQNTITIPDNKIKTAINSEYGMAEIIGGYMQGLKSQYIEWEKTHTANVVSEMLNSVAHPLKDSQKIELPISENVTRAQLKNLVAAVNNSVEAMELEATTAFNIASFPKLVSKDELVFVTKPGIKNTLRTQLLESAFNKDELNMDVKTVVVPNFGGLIPCQADGVTEIYPVYDAQGRPTGKYTEDSAGTTEYTGTVTYLDPNADVIGIIMEKGTIFIDEQNPYVVEPAVHNAAGHYQTFWASKENVGFHYDMYKNVIVIKSTSSFDIESTNVKIINDSLEPAVVSVENASIGVQVVNTSANPVPTQEITPTEG